MLSVFQRFLMTGARGAQASTVSPQVLPWGPVYQERHPAGGASWEPGRTPGSRAWASGRSQPRLTPMPEARVSRSALRARLAPAALVRPRGASLSHRAFEASSAPSTERDQVRGPRANAASCIADASSFSAALPWKVRTVLK